MSKTKLSPIELMETPRGSEIAWQFFLDYGNSASVSKKVYLDLWKRHQNARRNPKSSWTVPYVNGLQKKWNSEGFFTFQHYPMEVKAKGNSTRITPVLHYQLTLRPLFLYLEKRDNIILVDEEKNFLCLIFNNKKVRQQLYSEYKNISFLEAIPKFYFKYFYLPYLKEKSKKTSITQRFNNKRFTLNKEWIGLLDNIQIRSISQSIREYKENQKLLNTPIGIKERMFTKKELRHELESQRNLNASLYLINPAFKKSKDGKYYYVDYDNELMLFHYLKLHEYSPEIADRLDNKMEKMISG